MKQNISIPYELLRYSELSPEDKLLEEAAQEAAQRAYAPYSQFLVGAALRLENGIVLTGNNQENAAYPSGLCAERTALFYAASQYPDVGVESLALVAINRGGRVQRITPCGACAQVIMECAMRHKPFRLLLCGRDEVTVIEDCRQILPFAFDGSEL